MDDLKTNLSDVTFLIPFRTDTMVRFENLMMVIDFINNHFNTNIHALEAASYNNQLVRNNLPDDVSVTFIEDYDPVFYRTKYINKLVQHCQTPYLAIWDADVIIPSKQIINSVKFLREDNASFVFPYKKNFLDVSPILRELYFKTRNLQLFLDHKGKMKKMYLPDPVGGCFLAKKSAYIKSGIENENYYGWGREDGDRVNRWSILNLTYTRIPGPLFHLTHKRGKNSTFHSNEQKNIKMSEIVRIASMSQKELKKEIETWNNS